MKKVIFIFSLFLLFSLDAFAETLTAKVNRLTIPQGETFVLTLDYDALSKSSPDLKPLEHDFKVYSMSNSFQTNMVNGSVTQSQQWQIGLSPLKEGKLTIPSITLGNAKSNPIDINVVEADLTSKTSDTSDNGVVKFSIKGEVDNLTPFVQQQINYMLSVYDATGGLQGKEPQFMDDGSNSWIVQALREPSVDMVNIDGKDVRKITFYYALFPQKSGRLKLPHVVFNGFYLTRAKDDPFAQTFGWGNLNIAGMFSTRNPVNLSPKEIFVEVQPIATAEDTPEATNFGIPAKLVEISAEWDKSRPQFMVGEAVTRTISVKAVGVLESQLPELNFTSTPDLKQYPSKPETTSTIDGTDIVSIRKISNVYIPQKSGELVIPGIEIKWFNITTGKSETAVLPEFRADVKPSNNIPETVLEKVEPAPIAAITTEALQENSSWRIYIIALITFVLGILISYILFRPKASRTPDYYTLVLESARAKDLKSLRDNLINWAGVFYKGARVTNLKDVAGLTKVDKFSNMMDALMVNLYGSAKAEFNLNEFMTTFKEINKRKKKASKEKDVLPKLYG